jgi:hypothetical protein
MDKQQIITDILKAYRKGEANLTIETKCSGLLLGLSEQMFKTVTDWILENPPEYRLDVKYVKNAINSCVPSGVGFPVFELDCPLCGLHFRHSPYAGSDHDEMGVHYYCPRCGLSGVEIMDTEDCLNKKGFCPARWEDRLTLQAARWKNRTNRFCPNGFAPYHDKRLDGLPKEPFSRKEGIERYAEFLAQLRKEIGYVKRPGKEI